MSPDDPAPTVLPPSAHRPGEFAGRRLSETPIAIVGMGGLFPQAATARDYWQNIVDGADCTTEVPADRWRIEDHFDPDPAAPDKSYSRRGGFVPDVEFDPLEFGLPPNQLEVTSVLQTLSLGVARDTLTDAGAPGSGWYDPSRTGVVLGVTGPVPLMHPLAARLSTPVLQEVVRSCGLSDDDGRRIAEKYAQAFAPWVENSFPGLLPNVVAGRIANRLGLGGMNSTVDAACAASLSAIRVAVAELVDGRADLMLTGGADTENSIFVYLCFSKVGALSRADHIRPFDAAADGTLIGEGIGMVALKRLADARRDGDRIYAVIAGVGSASDGRSKSIYAPRAEGQRLALDRAYDDAQISPATVELVEAHATGTAVGDRTELTALGGLLADHGAEPRSVAIGSVKSQIGHTKGAAGTASLMKVAYALHHRTLPATINVEAPNEMFGGADVALYPNTRTRPWIRDPQRPRRRGAVSAMGFGGTNFHVVLEEAPEGPADAGPRPVLHRAARAHVFHAADTAALAALLADPDAVPADGAVPADHARVGFAAVGGDEAAELRGLAAEGLRDLADDTTSWAHPRGIWFRRRAHDDLRVAAVFAGQGSQYLDMGLDAAVNNPTVAAAFDEANAAFADAPRRLGAVVFPPPVFDPAARREQEAALRATEYAQPAIGALSVGQFRSLRERGLDPTAVMGHSFGELTALWAAGSLSDDAFFTLARARGAAMAPTPGASDDPGTMAAVSASRERVEELVAAAGLDDVAVCNHNAPGQVVVGGATDQVERFVAHCTEQGVGAKALPVAAAFHTAHVAHAVAPFRAAVDAVEVSAPRVPVVANTAGATYGDDVAGNRDVLVGQLSAPVEFVAGLEALRDHAGIVVEFGPKQVLTGLVQRVLGDDVVAVSTDAGPVGDADLALEQAAARLAVLGVPLAAPVRAEVPAPAPRATRGMTVTLSGAEYVPPERAAAYAAGLADDRPLEALEAARAEAVATAVPEPTAPAPSTALAARPSAAAPAPEVPVSDVPTRAASAAASPGDDVLAQQTALHARYLDGQLDLAHRLVGAWESHGGGPEATAQMRAVVDHADAVSRAHVRANEVLASLASLEQGVALPAPVAGPVRPAGSGEAPATHGTRALNGSAPTPDTDAAPPGTDLRLASPAPGPTPEPTPEPSPEPTPAAGFDAAALRSVLVEVVADKTGYPAGMVDPGLDLEADLGVDSIKRVQVLGAVQERYPQLPAIGPESMAELRTLDQIVAHFASEPADTTTPVPVDTTTSGLTTAPAGSGEVPRHPIELVGLPAREDGATPFAADPVAVLVDRGGPEPEALATALGDDGWTVRRVVLPETTGSAWIAGSDADEPLPGLDEALADRVDACLLVLRDDEDLAGSLRQLADAVLVAGAAQEPLGHTAAGGTRAAFVTVSRTDGGLGLLGHRIAADAVLAGVGGLVKTLAREAPALFCRALDIAPVSSSADAAGVVLAELRDAATDVVEVGIDADGARSTLRIADRPAPTTGAGTPIGPDDVVVVTGGARGVTAHCVLEIVRRNAPEVVLLGRTALTDEPAWAQDVDDADLTAAAAQALAADGDRPGPREVAAARDGVLAPREVRATLEAVRALGATARYATVDVTDPDDVRAALGDAAHRATVVVHAAGALADAVLPAKTRRDVHRVLAPKLAGLHHVLDALRDAPVHTVALFGSVAGVHGNPGQADYALANEALARWAASADRHRTPRSVTTLAWGAWDGGMVTPALREHFHALGVPLIGLDEGARAFADHLGGGATGWVLLGAPEPLAGDDPPAPALPATTTRDLEALRHEPVLEAHRVGDGPVLPATVALGWLVDATERRGPGRVVDEVRDLAVRSGVVYGDGPVETLTAEIGAPGPDGTVPVAVRGSGAAPRYSATLALGSDPATAAEVRTDWPRDAVGRGPEDGTDVYRRGVLFHGPTLQGVRRVLAEGDERLVLECGLPPTALAHGAYAGRRYDPVLADVVLHGPSVLGHRLLGSACLPLAIGRIELRAPVPADEPFVVIVENPRATTTTLRCDATVCAVDGRVLQRWTDVEVVTTPGMDERFARGVASWHTDSGDTVRTDADADAVAGSTR